MRSHFLTLFIVTWASIMCSQEDSKVVSIGILPVTSSASGGQVFTENVHEKITLAFNSKSRFTVVDRSKLEAIRKEQDLQKDAEFIEGVIVDQGKSVGAQYLVTANIIEIGTAALNRQKTNYFKNPPEQWTQLNLRARLVVSMKILDVETSEVKSSRDIVVDTEYDGTASARPAAHSCLLANVNAITGKVKAWSNTVFPVEMKVIRVEESDKKGLPETILVTGGEEMDMQRSRDIISNTSTRLEIIDYEIVDIGDREVQRPLSLGTVIVDNVQGVFAVCKINNKKEAAVIQDKLNQGRTLYLRIISY